MKKFLSVLLCAALLVTLFVPYAFAAEPTDYLSLGDSIAYGASLTDRKHQVAGAIVSRTNGYNYKNDAVNGHTTEMMLKRISESEVQNDITQAEIICVSIGGNDFLLGGFTEILKRAMDGDYTLMDEKKAQIYTNIGRIMDALKAINPNATILLQTLYNPMFNTNKLREAYQQGIDRLNQAVREYLEANPGAYTIVDVAAAFGNDPGLIAFDSIHPNAYGQETIAREILKTLNAIGLGTQTEPVLQRSKIAFFIEDLLVLYRKICRSVLSIFDRL